MEALPDGALPKGCRLLADVAAALKPACRASMDK
ncbi:hypothetical protein L284_11065 [Novosphingobium lindaniclasticum LE124]|uniref:Uncharacterized protein n=1 Tax=Novosphingobium lindaniclasticum LE124 TaxID=1096930 RepID=T0HSQ7_9SPHN|nr:hypothetical protein L284_11065 [Novosphingobium lindaniclasticum LE124]